MVDICHIKPKYDRICAINLGELKNSITSLILDVSKGTRLLSIYLKDYFLVSLMVKSQYIKIKWEHIPQEIYEYYYLHDKVNNSCIYIKIAEGMYGLNKAVILAYNKLVHQITSTGYCPVPGTSGFWLHKTLPITFIVYADDVGIKIFEQKDLHNIIDSLKYQIKFHIDITVNTSWVSISKGTIKKDI